MTVAEDTRPEGGSPNIRRRPQQEGSRAIVDALFEAVSQILAHSDTLTTNAVAARAGVSIGTLYQYFADRQGLLYGWVIAQLPDLSKVAPLPSDALLGPAIFAFTTGLCEWWSLPVRRAWMALDDANQRPLRLRVMREWTAALQAVLAEHQTAHQDPWAHRVVVAGLLGATVYGVKNGAFDDAQCAKTAQELALLVVGPLTWSNPEWRRLSGLTPEELSIRPAWHPNPIPIARPLRKWMRARPRQGRAMASVGAIIAAAGVLIDEGLDYTAERLAARAGVSVGTVYRYFSEPKTVATEFGIAQMANYAERMIANRGGIYLDAPGAGIARLIKLTLDPLRGRLGRYLRVEMFARNERELIDQQIAHLHKMFAPSVLQHPFCRVDFEHFAWVFHSSDGVAVWLTANDGLHDDALGYGHLVEANAQMVFTFSFADRDVGAAVLAGERPMKDLHNKSPGLPER